MRTWDELAGDAIVAAASDGDSDELARLLDSTSPEDLQELAAAADVLHREARAVYRAKTARPARERAS